MCNPAGLKFGLQYLSPSDVQGKRIIEVGARDVNGSLRTYLEGMGPSSYLGVDIENGPGVDAVCDIFDLVARYGRASFDIVVCTEVMEHVRDWRSAISNLKRVLTPNGILLLTTRSKGFPYHAYPYDFWRYEVDDIRHIFSDMTIDAVESDPLSPGVFVKAHMPASFTERELDSIHLYSIVTHSRTHDVTNGQVYMRRIRHKVRRALAEILPKGMLTTLDRMVTAEEPQGRGAR